MKARLILFIIFFIALLVFLPVFSYSLRDFIEVYKFKISSFPQGYSMSLLKNVNTYKVFINQVDPPNGISWFLLLYFLYQSFFGSFNVLKIKTRFKQTETYGSHGTARFQVKKEIKEDLYNNDLGWFIGCIEENQVYSVGMKAAYHAVSNNTNLNMQINVVGPPGSNKTTGLIYPNLFHIPYAYKKAEQELPDIIVTDPKSEIFCLTAEYYEKLGYDVKVLDFIHLSYGDQLNSIDFINSEKELMEVARGYVLSVAQSGGGKVGGEGKFWTDQSAQVLGALIGYVQQKLPKEKQTFAEISKILTSDFVGDIEKAKEFFKESGITGAALQLWNNFLMVADSDRTRANILGSLAVDMSLFAIEGIANITNRTTIDITKFGAKKEKPMILYIFMPDGDRTFSPIINVVNNTLLTQLYKTAYKYNNKLHVPVYILWEEIANIGFITGLEEKLGTMRGRRIYPMMIWQDLVQMKKMYGDTWETVLAKCDSQLYLGVNDEFTAKYVSETIGKTTINVQGVSKNIDGVFASKRQSESNSYSQRPLLYPDEVRRFDNKKLLFYQRSKNPVVLFKVQYKYWESKNLICTEKSVFDLPKTHQEVVEKKFALENVNIVTHEEQVIANPMESRDNFTDIQIEMAVAVEDTTDVTAISIDTIDVAFTVDDFTDDNIDTGKSDKGIDI